ncbi:MAG: hypothetical protein WKF85_01285 [Chitinophagaceae bacterium]
MSEVLLQSIVEKLEAIEISLLKDNNPVKGDAIQALLKEVKSFQSQLAKFPLQFEKSTEKTSELLKTITSINFRLDNPVAGQIKNSHHFHKVIWIAFGLFIFCVLLLYGWVSCHNEKKAFEANDIKYRYLKVNGNSNLLIATYSTDSLYKLGKAYFTKKVVEKEKDFANQNELYRIANEKKKETMLPKIPRRSKSKN